MTPDLIRTFDNLNKMNESLDEMNAKLDWIIGMEEALFEGNDAAEIRQLVNEASDEYGMTKKEVYDWVNKECVNPDLKQSNLRLMNYLRNKLGYGVKGVVTNELP